MDDLVARAMALAERGGRGGPGGLRRRRVLGITGPPAAGKSTLAARLAAATGAPLVGMDGFHIGDAELVRLGRRDRKGAPDTFDAHGYLALLRRVRAADEPVVYAPVFDRRIEDSIAAAVAVPADAPLVITEGNYLLLDAEPWRAVRTQLDEVWYLDPPEPVRIARLIARRVALGADEAEARRWALGSDQHNADLTATGRPNATLWITREW